MAQPTSEEAFCQFKHLWSAKVSAFSLFSVPAVANMMVVSRSAMIPDTALAAVMQAWVPRLPAWRAASTKETCTQVMFSVLGSGTGASRAAEAVRKQSASQSLRGDLFGDFAGAFDQLLLGDQVVGAALQSSSLGHQACAAEAQLAHLLPNVRANLEGSKRHSITAGLSGCRPASGGTYFVVLCRQRCKFGLVSQVSKLVGQLVGQTAEVIGVGVRLGDLEGDKRGL